MAVDDWGNLLGCGAWVGGDPLILALFVSILKPCCSLSPSHGRAAIARSSQTLIRRVHRTPYETMDNEQVSFYLSQFIGKNLRIHTSDDRVFGDQMKCTNKVRHIDYLLRPRPLVFLWFEVVLILALWN